MKDLIAYGASLEWMPTENPAGKIIYVTILVAVFIVSYVALVALLAAMLKQLTARGREAVETKPWMTLAYGLVGWLVFGGLAALANLQAAIVLIIIPSLICVAGAPGLYLHIGGRIGALKNGETSDLHRVVLGCGIALVAMLFPGIGWFIVLPLFLMAEFGTGVQALLRR